MSERHQLWHALDRLQMDNRAQAARIVEIRAMISSLNLPGDWKPPRAGSPRELHRDACPHCEIVGGHTSDCVTLVHLAQAVVDAEHSNDRTGLATATDELLRASKPAP